MTKEERLAWFEQSIYPEPLKFTNEIDSTVYIVRAFLMKPQAKALKKSCEEL